jgi:superfamily II DNA or RNA helicase
MKMHGYQQIAYEIIKKALIINIKALMVMATGLGKTIVSAFIARDELREGKRGLFLCHENDILNQALGTFRAILGKSPSLSKFYGSAKDWNGDQADILFASFQSFKEWHMAFDSDHFDFIIVDESHHGQAPTYREVVQYFKPKKLLGMTATPNRGDEKDIREIFGEEVVDYSLEEAIAKGWLASVEYRILRDNINTKALKQIMVDVLEKGERISIKQLNETIFIKKRDIEIAKEILSFDSKKIIIFCENIEHANNFSKYLPGSCLFHSKLSDGRNSKSLEDFRSGKKRCILSVNKFNEGIDIPEADLIVFLRSTNSETVFFQQLGRGLRLSENKKKVTVLDFVANLERLAMIKGMTDRIRLINNDLEDLSSRKFFIEGERYNLIFDKEMIDLITVLDRLKSDFYPTWQEASHATISLGVRGAEYYKDFYKKDCKLPSNPNIVYPDFPGWRVFLGKEEKDFYPTWEEASKVAISLGMKEALDYRKGYRKDSRLPSNPNHVYSDFPGWIIFLGGRVKNFYSTWQEASRSAIALGTKSQRDYQRSCKINLRLPTNPFFKYSDFPGWYIFLGEKPKDLYPTLEEASKSAIALGIRGVDDYKESRKKDPRLPGNPHLKYPDFPGWPTFLGENPKNRYSTWQEASKSAIALKIESCNDYEKRRGGDLRLPAYPNTKYPDFPGWPTFLGKNPKNLYPAWQEASKSAITLGIKGVDDYKEKRKKDPRLPGDPSYKYPDFPGWYIFLGKPPKNLYPTWQEASRSAITLGIRGADDYKESRKKDPRLPGDPSRKYPDFPGWRVFLGKE